MPQIPQLAEDLAFISKLGDNPNTDDNMSSQDLKAEFDKAPLIIQQFINDYVIPALNNYILGSGYLPIAGGYMTGKIAMNGYRITSLGAPADRTDAVNKAYVDDNTKVTEETLPIIPVLKGGTGAESPAKARENLGAAATQHQHGASDITEVIPVAKGGTGAVAGNTGLKNLLAAGPMILSPHQFGSALPEEKEGIIFEDGMIFLVPIKKVT